MANRHQSVIALVVLLGMVGFAAWPSGHAAGPTLRWHVAEPARGTPAIDANTAFFLTRQHVVVALARDTGEERWRTPLGARPDELTGSTLVVAGDVVIGGGYELIALDRETGARRWSYPEAEAYGFGFYIGATDDDRVFTGSSTGGLYAFDGQLARPVWSASVGGPSTTVHAPVLDRDDVAAAFTDFGTPRSGGVVMVDRATGRERWRVVPPAGAGSPIGAGPIFAGDFLVVTFQNGVVCALSRQTGEVRWVAPPTEASSAAAADTRPLAFANGVVVVGSLTGSVTGLDRRTGRERWRVQASRASVAFALAANRDVVYVPTLAGENVALDAGSGRELWRIGGPTVGMRWPPRVDGVAVFVAASQAGFFAFRDLRGRTGG